MVGVRPKNGAFRRTMTDYQRTKLRDATRMSSSTMAKLSNNQAVAMPVLEKICAVLDCNIGDVMEFTDLSGVKDNLKNETELVTSLR